MLIKAFSYEYLSVFVWSFMFICRRPTRMWTLVFASLLETLWNGVPSPRWLKWYLHQQPTSQQHNKARTIDGGPLILWLELKWSSFGNLATVVYSLPNWVLCACRCRPNLKRFWYGVSMVSAMGAPPKIPRFYTWDLLVTLKGPEGWVCCVWPE